MIFEQGKLSDFAVQSIQQIIEGPSDTLFEDLIKTYFSVRLAKISLTDKLLPEIFFIFGFEHGDYQLSPNISYRVTDKSSIIIGADIFGGPKYTLYGQFHKKDRMTFTISHIF